MGVGVIAFAEASDGDALGVGQEANDAPGVELGSVLQHGFE